MATQQALVVPEKFAPFTLQHRPKPSPKEGQLLVKVQAVGLNPADWKIQQHGVILETYPVVLGNDVAGTVEQAGEGVEGWKIGDRVVYQGNMFDYDSQGFQHYTAIEANLVTKIPGDLSFSAAATLPVALSTATFALWGKAPLGLGLPSPVDGEKPRSSGPVVVIGGGGAVGQLAIQAFRASGSSPIITYASGKHTERLKAYGATHVIDRTVVPLNSLPKAIKEITSDPIKIVYDAVATEDTQNAAYDNIVASNGTVVVVLPSAVQNKVEGKNILEIWASTAFSPNHHAFAVKLYKSLASLLEAGIIVPLEFEELPVGLGEIPAALDRIKEEKAGGKKLIGLP